MTSSGSGQRGEVTGKSTSGFQGRIQGATLSDLVQMECLANSREVVRVTSGSHVGYLFFRGGGVVHALEGSLSGEAAALQMLSWNEGTFQTVDREWPAKESISCTWQNLLLRAAQLHDEKEAGVHDGRQVQSVVALRRDGRSGSKPGQEVMDSVEFDVTPIEVGGHSLRSEDFDLILRLSPTGTVTVNQGATQDFADIVAYACRLSELIGMLLGVERFVAMECLFKSGRCFIVLEEDGKVIALGPRPSVDLTAIRELLGV
jgi:Domain of unknown function (DUF4388)